ncbi:MAG: hypothetical protein ACXWLH_02000 [Candidatus Saccharimonadales bacterium]
MLIKHTRTVAYFIVAFSLLFLFIAIAGGQLAGAIITLVGLVSAAVFIMYSNKVLAAFKSKRNCHLKTILISSLHLF